MAVRVNFDGPLANQPKRLYHLTAKELVEQLNQGKRSFTDTSVTGDVVWDSVSQGNNIIAEGIDFSHMTFTGRVNLGDLTVSGGINLGGSIIHGRCAIYRTNAGYILAGGTLFEHGLGLVNSQVDIAFFVGACFAKDKTSFPSGLLIKQTTGRTLDLTDVQSPETILDCSFETVDTTGALLGRRTALTLGSLMALSTQ